MKKRIVSILLCICMALSLLPMSALAADANVSIGMTALESGKYYTISGVVATKLDSAPESGGYLYYTLNGSDAALTVTGDVTYNGSIPALSITACTLALTGSGNLTMTSSSTPAVSGSSGSLTTSNYTGNLSFNSTSSNAITNCEDVTLETTGALTLSGNSDNATISCRNDVTLKGSTVNLANEKQKQLINAGGEKVSVTVTNNHLYLSGTTDVSPLIIADSGEQGKSGTVTLSASGAITVANGGAGMAVGSALTASAGENITLESTSGKAVGGNLTVPKAAKVTVSGGSSTDPAINGAAEITAGGDITITSVSNLDIGGTDKLTAGGLVIRTKSSGTTITKDGTPISTSYGGDVSTNGLNICGNKQDGNADATYKAPTTKTLYKAGSGYVLFTPADGGTHTKLELHNATINTKSTTAITLPSDAPVDIVVASDSSLTAGGSGNVINTNGQSLSVTGSGNLTLVGPYYGINVNGTGAVSINTTGDLTFDTASRPIDTSGGITVSAKSITSKSGYNIYSGGAVSLTATDGDISLTTKNSFMGAVNCSGSVSLTANKGAVTIAHSDNASGGYALNGTAVTVSALKDVTITTSRGGIDASSGAVSVTSQSGSIQMDCAMDQCVSAEDAVALNAAKDITLNDSSTSSTAISATSRAVNVTAGGKLTSTSAYGFQTGALTIQANEVSVTGTEQDGIQANSVSITNPTGGNCKRVSVTATSSQDTRAAIAAGGTATTGNITVKADDLFLCGNGSAKAINVPGTVTIDGTGIIVGAISAGTDKISAGIARASKNGGKLSDKLDLKINTHTESTYYELNSGSHDCYIIFTPKSGDESAVLTLHDVDNAGYLMDGIILPDEPITLKLEGINIFFKIIASNNITVSGNGSLESEINNSNADAVLTVGNGATLNAMYSATADNITIYGTYYFSSTVSPTTKLKLNAGAVLKLEYGRYLEFKEGAPFNNLTIGAGATIVNDTHVTLPKDTTVEQIKALPLSGTGVVRVAKTYDSNGLAATWDTYTNNGVQVNEIIGGLDLTDGSHSGKTVESNGYRWDSASNTLTLGNHAYVSGGLTLPEHATIYTTTDSTINGSISPASNGACNLTFSGAGSLNVSGGIGNSQGGIMTVSGGAHVSVNGSVNIGTSGGAGGTLNVIGAGTTLNVSAPSGYAIFLETVNIGSGASVMATAEGKGAMGVEALSGGVHVTGGSTLTTGCAYGVYIEGGKLEVDSSSKLVTNGAVAPFCIVDTASSKVQDNVLSLPGTPEGTAIKSVTGTTDFSGKKHTYWSLTDGGNLNVVSASENTTPVTLTGAKTGTLTFVKASSNGDNNNGGNNNSGGGGSGGGSSSVSYTLNFETNGGSKISSISKENGTTLDLASYKPTRDGYDFDGWYANQALTEKVTSVKLTKHTTIYAKWTEKSAKPVNPFADVAEHAYYYDAVLWAVQKNVTSGTTSTAFSPDMICTRAQMVTFLWRAMGSPEPSSANCPFTDVSKDAYYNKAVLWAVENGITAGVTETSFSPDAIVTRGQSVTFLWRAAGKPEVSSANPYTDVSKDAFYYNAMMWAVEKGITKGTSSTAFSPDGGCTRAQIVTFLYRYMGK